MLSWKVVSCSLGLSTAISFVLCVLWVLVTLESLHMHPFLEMVLPGFRWLSWPSFLLGLVESFLWGFYAGIVFVPIHNALKRRWA